MLSACCWSVLVPSYDGLKTARDSCCTLDTLDMPLNSYYMNPTGVHIRENPQFYLYLYMTYVWVFPFCIRVCVVDVHCLLWRVVVADVCLWSTVTRYTCVMCFM